MNITYRIDKRYNHKGTKREIFAMDNTLLDIVRNVKMQGRLFQQNPTAKNPDSKKSSRYKYHSNA